MKALALHISLMSISVDIAYSGQRDSSVDAPFSYSCGYEICDDTEKASVRDVGYADKSPLQPNYGQRYRLESRNKVTIALFGVDETHAGRKFFGLYGKVSPRRGTRYRSWA